MFVPVRDYRREYSLDFFAPIQDTLTPEALVHWDRDTNGRETPYRISLCNPLWDSQIDGVYEVSTDEDCKATFWRYLSYLREPRWVCVRRNYKTTPEFTELMSVSSLINALKIFHNRRGYPHDYQTPL